MAVQDLVGYLKDWFSRNLGNFSEHVEMTEFRDQDVIDEEVQRKMSSGSLFPSYTTGSGGSIEVKSRIPEDLRQAMQIVTDEDFPNSKWLYDTPGLINEDQVCKTQHQENMSV